MPRRLVPYLAFLAFALLSPAINRWHDASAADGRLQLVDDDTIRITPEMRHAGLRFAPEVTPADRAWVEAAIATARPEAQRLVHEVDGMVTISTAGSGPMMGLTKPSAYDFTIWLNVARLNGSRRLDRDTTVLHEFGHVIDFALITRKLGRQLDDAIPRGGRCETHNGIVYGNCAPPEERVADTFAKWALGGAVSAVGSGYAISNPASLDDWGLSLVTLAAALPD